MDANRTKIYQALKRMNKRGHNLTHKENYNRLRQAFINNIQAVDVTYILLTDMAIGINKCRNAHDKTKERTINRQKLIERSKEFYDEIKTKKL